MKTIQQRLAEVDYSFTNYKPSLDAIMFSEFIKEVNKKNGGEENKTPIVHMKALDLLLSSRIKRKALMCFRGFAKSSMVEYLVLYGACFNKFLGMSDVDVIMYVANSMEKGAKDFRRNIESRYENSDFLQKMIPPQKIRFSATDTTSNKPMPLSNNDIDDLHNAGKNITDARIEFKNIQGKNFCARLFGVNTGIRGFKEYGHRPLAAVADDLLSDSDARSDTVIANIEDVVYKAITFALHPSRYQILWLGTPFNSKDPLYKAVESDTWHSVVFPVAEKFPCTRQEFRGAWEDRFTYDDIMEKYEAFKLSGKEQAFRQEMMLQIIPEEGLLVPKDKIIELPSETYWQTNKGIYNFYITTDFAYTDKESSDYSVISIWAVNSNNEYMLVDGFCGKQLIDKSIDLLFKYVQEYQPLQVGFELTGQQIGFVQILRTEMIKRNIFFNLKEIRPSKDKFSRFNLISPYFHQNKIMILSHMMKNAWGTEFTDEISKATIEGFKSKHDDVLDTISQLMDLNIFAPSTYTEMERESQNYKRYNTRSNLVF